jgi:hypothetical protein
MKNLFFLFLLSVLAISCTKNADRPETKLLNKYAAEYVRLGLTIGEYDKDFVDAYYGPDSLKPKAVEARSSRGIACWHR